MSLIQAGMEALVARQKVAATTTNTITYVRKSVAGPVNLTGKAWVGRTVFSRLPKDPGGGSVVWGDRDYLIAVADLAQGGVPFEPERGDRIEETIAGTKVTFEVLAPLAEPEKRYSDATRLLWRIHTKQQAV